MHEIGVPSANGATNIGPVNQRLGREITRAMTKAKLTSPELAKRADVGDSWIRQLRSGRIERPGADKLRRVARELGLDETTVLGMTDQLGASMAGASTAPQPEVPAALLQALADQTAAITGLVAELQADRRLIRDLLDLLVRPPDDPVEQAVTASKVEVLAAEEAAARELERTRLTPPRSGPRNPDGARRRTSREGETA